MKIDFRRVAGLARALYFTGFASTFFWPKFFVQRGLSLRRRIARSGCDTSDAASPASFSLAASTCETKTGKMKAVILAYCKQRQNSMVSYFGLVVSENAKQSATHMASMASLAIKWMRNVLAARRH